MKKLVCVLMCCTLLTACADDKRYAPKEGRISLSPEVTMTAAKTEVKLGQTQTTTHWKHVFQNTLNNRPDSAIQIPQKPLWVTDIGKNYNTSNLPESPVISFDYSLYALDGGFALNRIDLRDGHKIWRKPLTDNAQTPIGIIAGEENIFAVSEQGDVVAVSPDGEILWKKQLDMTLRTTPTANKKLLFVLSSKNILLALDQKTGNEVWRYQTANTDTFLRGMAHPALSKDILVVPFTTGDIIGFDAASGMLQWGQLMIGNQLGDLHELPHILASPVIDGNIVYLAGNANLMGAYDLHSGATKWTQNLGVLVTPVVSGNAIFIITKEHHLMALDTKTGRVFWDKEISHDKKTLWTGLQLQNNKLLLSNTDLVYTINPETGDIISEGKKTDMITTPIVINDAIVGVNERAKLKLYTQGDK